MIRALALLIGLVLGLTAAATVYGRMAHLRALAAPPFALPLALPGWSDALPGDAGVLAGSARGPAGAALVWRLDGVDAGGPLWAVQGQGAGLSLTLQARLATGPALALSGAAGEAVLTGPRLSGHFILTGGTGRLDAGGLSLDLSARARRLRLDGAELPDGRAGLTLAPDGGWQLVLDGQTLTGPDLAALLGE